MSSHKEGSEIPPFVTTWMGLEMIMLREISRKEKVENHMMSLTCGIETEKQQMTSRDSRSWTIDQWSPEQAGERGAGRLTGQRGSNVWRQKEI